MDKYGNMGSARSPRPLRVLIVEASKYICARLKEALSKMDNVVILGTASTQADALVISHGCPWDVVVVDLQLKEGNGLDLIRKLDRTARTGKGKIAVFTGHTSPQVRERALAMGADFFFDNAREFDRMLSVIARLATSRFLLPDRMHSAAG
jgi:DNA-binding NarL/FixJ family response regulator